MLEKRDNFDTLTVKLLLVNNLAVSLSIFIAFVAVIISSSGRPRTEAGSRRPGIRISEFPERQFNR